MNVSSSRPRRHLSPTPEAAVPAATAAAATAATVAAAFAAAAAATIAADDAAEIGIIIRSNDQMNRQLEHVARTAAGAQRQCQMNRER